MQKRKLSRLMLAVACSLCAMNAMAIAPGFYMGLTMGPSTNGATQQQVQVKNPATGQPPTSANPQAVTAPANPKETQFGSSFLLGYKFNSYAAFEGGFAYFSGVQYILKDKTLTPVAGTTARVRMAYFAGKVDYTYSDTIGFFAKAGVAAIYTTVPGGLQPTNWHTVPGPVSKYPNGLKSVFSGSNQYEKKLSPMFAIGASYDLNQSWQLDVTATRYFVGGAVNNVTAFALGLSYHFVDVYCGQFLCGD